MERKEEESKRYPDGTRITVGVTKIAFTLGKSEYSIVITRTQTDRKPKEERGGANV